MSNPPNRENLEGLAKRFILDTIEVTDILWKNLRIVNNLERISINQEDGACLYTNGEEIVEPIPMPILLLAKGSNYSDEYLLYGQETEGRNPLALLLAGNEFRVPKPEMHKSLFNSVTSKRMSSPTEALQYYRTGGDYNMESPYVWRDLYNHNQGPELIFTTPQKMVKVLIDRADKDGNLPFCILFPPQVTIHFDSCSEFAPPDIPMYYYRIKNILESQFVNLERISNFGEP